MGNLAGTMTAMVTPFDSEGRVDLGPLDSYLAFQQAGGITGLVVCGTNGEGTSLSVEERKRYLEAVIERRGAFTIGAFTMLTVGFAGFVESPFAVIADS